MAILVEAYYSSVDVNKATDDVSFSKRPKFSMVMKIIKVICYVIIPPSSIRKFITGLQVHAPYINLSRQIHVHQKVITANTQAYFWVFARKLIQPKLKIVFVVLFFEIN